MSARGQTRTRRLLARVGARALLTVSMLAVAGGITVNSGPQILRQALASRPAADDELRYQRELQRYEQDMERYEQDVERYEEALERYEEERELRRAGGDGLPPPLAPVEPVEPEPPGPRSDYAPPMTGLRDALAAVDGLRGPLTVLLTAVVPLGVVTGGVLLALGMNRGMQLVLTSVGAGALVLLGQGMVL